MLRSPTMALTYVAGTVTRPGRRRRPVSVRFLVDTGAVYTVLPRSVWRGLGLRGHRVVEFTLADGTAIHRDVSECRIQGEGRSATSPLVLGGPTHAASCRPPPSRPCAPRERGPPAGSTGPPRSFSTWRGGRRAGWCARARPSRCRPSS